MPDGTLHRKQAIAGGVTLHRAVKADAVIVDAKRRVVQLTWASDDVGFLRASYFDTPWIEFLGMEPEECDLTRLDSGTAPFLWGHDDYSRAGNIGVVESAWLKGGRGFANVRFSGRASVEDIVQDVNDGILSNVSVGYAISERTLTKTVEGGPDEYRLTRWMPLELSLCSIPVDDTVGVGRSKKAGGADKFTITEIGETEMPAATGQAATENRAARNAADNQNTPTNTVPAKVLGATATEGGERPVVDTPTRAEGDTRAATGMTEQQVEAITQRVTAAERSRIAEIRSLADTHELGDAFVSTHTASGANLAAVRSAALEALVTRSNDGGQRPRNIEVTRDVVDKTRAAVGDWLLRRAGHTMQADGKTPINLDGNDYRGMTLIDLCRDRLTAAGVNIRGLDPMEIAKRAITHSTSDFPIILGNVFNKILLAAYGIIPDTWRTFVKTGTLTDFRDSNRYRMGTFGDLALVPEGGEYQYGTIADAEKNPARLQTKGKIFSVTRQLLINDDMGALNDILTLMGRGAKRGLEKDFYALLALNSGAGPTMADGFALFSSQHGNLLASGTAPTIASIALMDQAMRTQLFGTDYIDVGPDRFLSTVALAAQVAVLNKSVYDDTANKFQKPNQVFNFFTNIVGSPRVLDTTQWYVFADPNVEPVIELDFLNGQQEPVTEQRDGWNVDGIEYKVRFDYGYNAVGYRGARKNPGA